MSYDSSPSTDPANPPGRIVCTVSELTDGLKECLQSQFTGLWVAGEVSDVSRPQSGHVYFSLKDEQAKMNAVLWRTSAARLKFHLEDGMEVLCLGGLDIYPPRGSYQLIVRDVELRGEGSMQRALRQLHERLEKEGLFDPEHKQSLPRFPRRVAVITSPTGAAIRDFLEVARRRWSEAELMVLPVRVQGDECVDEIVGALQLANRRGLGFDVIVLTRGGGSMEDLWGFNAEKLVRAIHASRVPVVSAIGHEIDVTLSDLVADLRALTPSEAAERVLPSTEEVLQSLRHLSERMDQVVSSRIEWSRDRLAAFAARRVMVAPLERIEVLAQRLDDLDARGRLAMERSCERSRLRMARVASQLDTLSPLGVLARGYSLTTDGEGEVIRRADQVQVGDEISTRLSQGAVRSRVESLVD